MSKNKFDRTPVADSIPEVSVPESIPEVSAKKPETAASQETETVEKKVTITSRGYVYADGFNNVRIRKEPNVTAKIVTIVPVGEVLTLGETVDGWTHVNWKNLFEGWMMDKYIARYR